MDYTLKMKKPTDRRLTLYNAMGYKFDRRVIMLIISISVSLFSLMLAVVQFQYTLRKVLSQYE